MKVFLVTLVFTILVLATSASQLRSDPTAPCLAYGNATKFDITQVFDYPVEINNDPRGYTYWFDPCKGVSKCSGGAAMCQQADQIYNCGEVAQTMWLLGFTEPPSFTILYGVGTDWRFTNVTFVQDSTADKTTIEFVNEQPYEQYNFLVRGKCVGMPYYPCGGASVSEEERLVLH